MGAVQKLATVVIVGLVGLATLLVVYLAYEPERRDDEVGEQQEVAIERGIETYIANCLTCHGPGGEGYSEPGAEDTGRIGAPLGGMTEEGRAAQEQNQSEDPTTRERRRQVISSAIHNGRALMPAWGRGASGGALLNDEQIEELILMIQHVDWDLVYNEAVEAYGGFPTPPAAPAPAAAQPQPTQAPAGGNQATGGGQAPGEAPAGGAEQGGDAAAGPVTVEGFDIGWAYQGQRTAPGQPISVPVSPGATVSLPNVGQSLHNFSVEAFGIDQDMPVGETVAATVPADAAPGEYEFVCDIPGHAAAGMIGTLVIE